MRAAIIYSSVTGNTKGLACIIQQIFRSNDVEVALFKANTFPLNALDSYDFVVIGTYTWGSGEIPKEMIGVYKAFELHGKKSLITGVFGTGDSFYPSFCGAVDAFRDMLFVHTNLAVTLKVELMPQLQDYARCEKFVRLLMGKAS